MWNVESWTDLAQYWDIWQELLNAILILRVLQHEERFVTYDMLASLKNSVF